MTFGAEKAYFSSPSLPSGTVLVNKRHHLISIALILCASGLGCAGIGTSRWAMDDEVYANKYEKAYPSNDADKVGRIIKQASDARYVADRGGWYAGAAGSDDPFTAGAEFGTFSYQGSAIETRAGLKGLVGTGAEDWFAGVDLGIRAQSPSRFAPFAGIGTFIGGNSHEVEAENDFIDNDDDGSIDELGEVDDDMRFLASVYPELGAHFWLTSSTRMTASAQYHITTEGRDSDYWFFGISFAFLGGSDEYAPEDE